MSRTLHPIEALILAAVVTVWAARVLTVALVALALLLAGWRPAAASEAPRSAVNPSRVVSTTPAPTAAFPPAKPRPRKRPQPAAAATL